MSTKLLILLVILSSLLGYLEWGDNNTMFLFEAEYEVIYKLIFNTKEAIHPFTILPLLGQLVLLINLFLKKPIKWSVYVAIAMLGLLLAFIFFIGILNLNWKLIISTLPFLVLSFLLIKALRKPSNLIP